MNRTQNHYCLAELVLFQPGLTTRGQMSHPVSSAYVQCLTHSGSSYYEYNHFTCFLMILVSVRSEIGFDSSLYSEGLENCWSITAVV